MKTKQVNIRPAAETMERLARVRKYASAAVGLELSLTDIFRLGLIELERKYVPAELIPGAQEPAAKQKRKRS